MEIDEGRFIEVLRRCAIQAGHVARHLQGKVVVEEKAGEASPEAAAVTAVDRATQDVILSGLIEEFPGIALDTEEDTACAHRFLGAAGEAPLVVLDPVDGTLNYTRGSTDYAVMGVLVTEQHYRAALIHFPAYAQTYWAIAGHGCTLQHGDGMPQRLRPQRPDDRIFVPPNAPLSWHERLRALAGQVEVSRCSAVCASAQATGRARAAVAPERADRRRAIGYLLSTEAGGAVYFGSQRWSLEDPATLPETAAPTISAQTPELAAQIRKALT